MDMSHLITLIKCNLIKQTRRYLFFMIIGISIFLGFLCVPGATAGYEIFYLGGVRGIYNSAWLGVLGTVLPVILLWLPGFYLLRSQITEDEELKMGQMIAASPISKFRYIYGKMIANFSVLMVLQLIFLAALMVMQLFQRESMSLSVIKYIQPLIFITIPYLLVLAALTVLLDVVPFLKGVFGNIVIFMLWISLSSISVANPGNRFDLFGMGVMLNAMIEGARAYFPNLSGAASFGYYTVTAHAPTFVWNGVTWEHEFLVSRLIWVIAALVITQASVLIFNRFKETAHGKIIKERNSDKQEIIIKHRLEASPILSGVTKSKSVNLPGMVWGELKIMLSGHSLWWYLTVLAVMGLTPFVTYGESLKWISLSMLLPLSIWAQMGNREKSNGTSELIISSCPATAKWFACWLAGIIVAMLMSLGMFARIVMLSEWGYFAPWLVGVVFIPTLALVFGGISGNRRLFEAVFITLMYFGPINDMWKFDFMGLTSNNASLYMTVTVILYGIGIATQILKEKRQIGAWR
jgi:hypothetical protein